MALLRGHPTKAPATIESPVGDGLVPKAPPVHHHPYVSDLPPDSSFFRSIRFRLTATYALLLIVILIALGIVLRILLVRNLESDVNQRLLTAAENIARNTSVSLLVGENESPIIPPDITPYQLAGFQVGVIDTITRSADEPTSKFNFIPNYTSFPDPRTSLSQIDFNSVYSNRRAEVQEIVVKGNPYRVVVYPFDPLQTGNVSGIIVVGQSSASLDKTTSLLNQVLLFVGAVGVILAVIAGWWVAGRALSPVGRITRTADEIAEDQNNVTLSKRLTVSNAGDELSQLALTFNAMLDRLESAFGAQQRFVADASHELRTPLTAMRGNVDVLLRQIRAGKEVPAVELRDSLGDVQVESERMARLITDLLTLARTDAAGLGSLVNPEVVSLEVLAREAFRTGQALAQGQTLSLDIRQPVMFEGDGDRIVQVMIILLENAIRHTPRAGSILLAVDSVPRTGDEPGYARIIVSDSGEGIPADHLPHLFERFYRVEGARTRSQGGTGLGLAIALSIVRAHHGWIDVESGVGLGTTFTIWLPLPTGDNGGPVAEPPLSLANRIPRIGHRVRDTDRTE